jgi:type II secretory pathway pseudopilin PulG
MTQPSTEPASPLFPPEPKPAQPAPSNARWIALVVIALIAGATAVALYTMKSVRDAADDLTKAVQPVNNFKTVLSGAIGRLNNQPKLVVLTADVIAKVTQENSTTFAGVDVGSAKVEVSAPATVQYYVPLDRIKPDDFYFDASAKTLMLSIDHPLLDTDVVGVESNPDKINVKTEYALTRPLSLFKGSYARDEAMRHLKEAALAQGNNELLHDRADTNAKKSVGEQLSTVFQALGQGVKFEVTFKK